MVKIEFFLKSKSLGAFECIDSSNHEDRDTVAMSNGIDDYDKVVLDDGRLELTRNERFYIDPKGQVWNIHNSSEDQIEHEIIMSLESNNNSYESKGS